MSFNDSQQLDDEQEPVDFTTKLEAALPDRAVTAAEAMTAIVANDGNMMLAAASLKCKQANLLTAIVQDQANADHLASYLRSFSTLKTFMALGEMHDRVMANLDALHPRDLANVYIKALDTFSKFVEKDTQAPTTSNPLDLLLRSLPPAAREAFETLTLDQKAS